MPISKLSVAVAVLVAAAAPAPSVAQPWPSRAVTMLVPFAAGGSSDAIGRILAEGLRGELGQPVIVENVGGAGGMTGANRVAKAAPDGYAFVLGNVGTHAQNQTLYKKPLYNAATDFEPVVLVTDQSLVLTVSKDFPADDLRGFIAYAGANQEKMRYGSAGVGGSTHLGCVLLNAAIGIKVTHIPYRSSSQAMQDLLAGRLDYQCPSAPTALPLIAGNLVKALAVLSKYRSPSMPGLASAHEQGLTGFDVPSWYAIFLPKGAPPAIVNKLRDATVAAMEKPLIRQRLNDIGCDQIAPERSSPEYLRNFVASEIEKWAIPIRASGVQID
jgi:tripartite-type tricarboxylate transporter receptor subunit TctC